MMLAQSVLAQSWDSLPTVGGSATLIVIIGIIGRFWYIAEKRHEIELNRVNKAHDEEIEELRKLKAELRGRIEELNKRIEEERARRFAAEDLVAKLRHGE